MGALNRIMPPCTPYAVYTIKKSICFGGHFYATGTMKQTLCGILREFASGGYVTNALKPGWIELLQRIVVAYHRGLVLGEIGERGMWGCKSWGIKCG